jgi:ELWxxDGT repeat protein
LWKSDGTRSGTKLVKDINTGPDDSDPDQLTAYRGVLLFSADDGVHGTEMWRSDGTKANTALLIDLEPGAVGSDPGGLTTSGKFLYFAASNPSAGEELWAVSRRGIGG